MTKNKKSTKLERILPYILLVGSIVGLVAAFALTYDKIQVLKDPSYRPSCNINPILSCGSVMKTEQASLLGVPNTIFGIMGFSALATMSIILLSGVKLTRRLWLGLQVGLAAGFVFMFYLFFQGVYRINAICPFCFAIWMVMPVLFWYTFIYNLQAGNLALKPRVAGFIQRHHGDIIIAWYVLIFGLLTQHFWYYWSRLI